MVLVLWWWEGLCGWLITSLHLGREPNADGVIRWEVSIRIKKVRTILRNSVKYDPAQGPLLLSKLNSLIHWC